MVCQSSTKVLQVRPVVPVEAVADLRAHIGEEKSLIQGVLAPFGVGSGDLMPAVIARAKIVMESSAELLRYSFVLYKTRMASIGIVGVDRGWCNVFGDPGRISRASIKR